MEGWRKLGELRVDDHVAAARSLPLRGRRRWRRHEILVLADLIAEGNLCHPGTFSIRGCGARKKYPPPEVFELCDSNIALFLARLWEGGGGFSRKGRASYDSASPRLAEEVQHLLLRLGITARLYRRTRACKDRTLEYYRVSVTGEESLQRFWRYVGRRFRDLRRRRRSQALAACRNGRMSRDVYWDRIVSIEALDARPTYDLQIEGNHNFLANNLVVHNSHAASFALLVYDSSWLKCYEPAAFTCALLNSLPMGFYAPAQLVRDAREHGVEVRPVRVEASNLESTLERRDQDGQPALRLGMRLVKALSEEGAKRIVKARARRPFASVQDLAERAALDRTDLEALAGAGALASLSGNRHLAFWEVAGTEKAMPLAPRGQRAADDEEGRPLLTSPTPWQTVLADYSSTGLTLGPHPLQLLRERLATENILRAQDLREAQNGTKVKVAGIVLMRQHPSSAKGVIFMTIEDETGPVNLIVWSSVADAQRRPLLESRLLEVQGELQHQHGVMHVIAERLIDRSALIGELLARSRDFH
jgi:hypothetical protein